MSARAQDYGLALISVVVTALVRFALIPVLGNRFGFDLFLVSTFLSGRYLGFGPSLFTLVGGAIPVTVIHFLDSSFDLYDHYFPVGLLAYLILGTIVVVLCKSERDARGALQREIAERTIAQRIVGASESRFQAIINNTSAVIYLKDWEGRYLLVNRRYEELFNVTQQQIVGKTDAEVFPSEVVAALQANDRQVRDTKQALEFEEVVPHADGPHTYVSVKFPIFDPAGQCNAVGGISTDISDRKRAADVLEQEQEMLRHTIEAQDQERQLIAYEIHDGLVQYATGALMQLESVQGHLNSAALAEQIEKVVDILRKTVDEGRRIINGMHTTVLDDCGIVAAVHQLIEDDERAHVQVDFVKDEGLGRMAHRIELALYHITQEALTNAHKHSQSSKVRVELSRREDRVRLEVRDWGVGFTPPANPKGVHGLRGMTERARIAGGRCTIENACGGGTQVVVDLPYLGRN